MLKAIQAAHPALNATSLPGGAAAARPAPLFLLATAAEDLDPAGNERHADGDARWDALVGLPFLPLADSTLAVLAPFRNTAPKGQGLFDEDDNEEEEEEEKTANINGVLPGAPPLHPRWRDRAAAPGVGARSHRRHRPRQRRWRLVLELRGRGGDDPSPP